MVNKNILCSISTRNRYDTTLPLAIQSVIQQTLQPDALVIFDDNDTPKDLREIELYRYLFQMLDINGIGWQVAFGPRKGQHWNHQAANEMGYKWVWRLDDDTVADMNVLQNLYALAADDVGAIGGSILTPPIGGAINATGKIENINNEPNIQWGPINDVREVDHLHCSFLYRAGIHNYDLSLSRVAHREETLFTYGLKQKGYKLLVAPSTVTWHLRNSKGGIRDGVKELYEHDELIFHTQLNHTVCVLDSGMGDHIVFKHVLPEIKNPLIFSCYPDIIPGKSIGEAQGLFGDLSRFNLYMWMDRVGWKGSLEDAMRKFYIGEKGRW